MKTFSKNKIFKWLLFHSMTIVGVWKPLDLEWLLVAPLVECLELFSKVVLSSLSIMSHLWLQNRNLMVFSVGQGFSFSKVCDPCVRVPLLCSFVCHGVCAVSRCVCLCTSQAAYRSQLIDACSPAGEKKCLISSSILVDWKYWSDLSLKHLRSMLH